MFLEVTHMGVLKAVKKERDAGQDDDKKEPQLSEEAQQDKQELQDAARAKANECLGRMQQRQTDFSPKIE